MRPPTETPPTKLNKIHRQNRIGTVKFKTETKDSVAGAGPQPKSARAPAAEVEIRTKSINSELAVQLAESRILREAEADRVQAEDANRAEPKFGAEAAGVPETEHEEKIAQKHANQEAGSPQKESPAKRAKNKAKEIQRKEAEPEKQAAIL